MHAIRLSRQLFSWLLLTLTLLALPAGAGERVVDAAAVDKAALSLTPYVSLLEDPEQSFTLADVQAPAMAARFQGDQPPGNALALGFTRSAFWLRLVLHNPGDTPLRRMLVVENPRISHVEAHIPDAQGVYHATATGCDVAPSSKAYANRNFVFPLLLPAHSEQVIYLRVASSVGLLVPLQLWPVEAFHAYERDDYVSKVWYFGIATAMVLFNLMLFVALRDRVYLLYVAFVSCTAFTLAIKNGLAPDGSIAGLPLNSNVAYYSGVSLALSAMLLFTRRMLRTDQLMPRVDRLLLAMVALYLVTPLLYAIALPLFSRLAVYFNLATAVVVLGVALAGAIKRQRSAWFFLAAFALLMLGGAMTTLRAMGLMPTNMFTVDGIQLGSAMEMIVLAFALADRFNVMRRDKARVQEELLQAQQMLVETLQGSERELELRVAQRTDELQELNSKLETLSLTDALTGIANRRHFDEVLQQEWHRAQRTAEPLALAILDVDWFKRYNDHYGHPAGDACLQRIAQVLASTVSRSSDLVARYGGEEFVFLVPMTDAAGAQGIAQRLVQAIEELALPHELSTFGRVTVSIGVAAMVPGQGEAAETLLQRADAALYEAKKAGRNRVGRFI
ncbi:sensor domain-containing diguanylate cyclase [Pseudomonas sp. PDM13]|uniref:sensor domain-containing diguanylate cyclase n=1 Tax=Pseudomonas sp. PDM13 TaxID=2769255 RepID=UPI0021DF94C9|nr:sensor domain-containing diguanylate cyclase [Pseudomonas sp. PDM13]MCU9947760.1 sensor domain-containing diguanylate cyclase [Pseudomonas sp. PDM13]